MSKFAYIPKTKVGFNLIEKDWPELFNRIELAEQNETLYVRRGDTHFIEAKKVSTPLPDAGKKVEQKEPCDMQCSIVKEMQKSIDTLTDENKTLKEEITDVRERCTFYENLKREAEERTSTGIVIHDGLCTKIQVLEKSLAESEKRVKELEGYKEIAKECDENITSNDERTPFGGLIESACEIDGVLEKFVSIKIKRGAKVKEWLLEKLNETTDKETV